MKVDIGVSSIAVRMLLRENEYISWDGIPLNPSHHLRL
jgi:hypothetical protein